MGGDGHRAGDAGGHPFRHRRRPGRPADVLARRLGGLAPGHPGRRSADRHAVRPGVPVHRPRPAIHHGFAHVGVPLYRADLLCPRAALPASQRTPAALAVAGRGGVLRRHRGGLRRRPVVGGNGWADAARRRFRPARRDVLGRDHGGSARHPAVRGTAKPDAVLPIVRGMRRVIADRSFQRPVRRGPLDPGEHRQRAVPGRGGVVRQLLLLVLVTASLPGEQPGDLLLHDPPCSASPSVYCCWASRSA